MNSSAQNDLAIDANNTGISVKLRDPTGRKPDYFIDVEPDDLLSKIAQLMSKEIEIIEFIVPTLGSHMNKLMATVHKQLTLIPVECHEKRNLLESFRKLLVNQELLNVLDFYGISFKLQDVNKIKRELHVLMVDVKKRKSDIGKRIKYEGFFSTDVTSLLSLPITFLTTVISIVSSENASDVVWKVIGSVLSVNSFFATVGCLFDKRTEHLSVRKAFLTELEVLRCGLSPTCGLWVP